MNDRQRQLANTIQCYVADIKAIHQKIALLVKREIPDYHFLNYAVSTFWTCDKSPVGMCVFTLNDRGRKTTCRYCDGPTERK